MYQISLFTLWAFAIYLLSVLLFVRTAFPSVIDLITGEEDPEGFKRTHGVSQSIVISSILGVSILLMIVLLVILSRTFFLWGDPSLVYTLFSNKIMTGVLLSFTLILMCTLVSVFSRIKNVENNPAAMNIVSWVVLILVIVYSSRAIYHVSKSGKSKSPIARVNKPRH